MNHAGEVALADDFSEPGKVDKTQWQQRQGTRWEKSGGVLRGIPSSAEYQAAREHHYGYEPRTSCPVTPAQFVARLSVRFLDGAETPIAPFVEFGHHVARIKFSARDGLVLLAD
ncbi:MAG: hypothetical protein ACYTGQ_19175, partial [Planctomycetota bacterium]